MADATLDATSAAQRCVLWIVRALNLGLTVGFALYVGFDILRDASNDADREHGGSPGRENKEGEL